MSSMPYYTACGYSGPKISSCLSVHNTSGIFERNRNGPNQFETSLENFF